MTDQELRHIYIEIASGRGNRGSFLTSFAIAVLWADPENFILLRSAAQTLVGKYHLKDYLDSYRVAS